MRRLARVVVPALGLALAVPSLALSPGAASAQVAPDATTHVKVSDGRHDVLRLVRDDGHTRRYARERSRRTGDVTSLRVRYQAGAVVARMHSVSLERPTGKLVLVGVFELKIPGPNVTAIVAVSGAGRDLYLLVDSDFSQDVVCPGLHARVGYERGKVSVTVPVSCLGSPRWVRTRSLVDYFRFTHKPKAWYDQAPGSGLWPRRFTHRVTPPAGTVTRSVMPRLLPGPSSLSPRIARTLRSIGFLG